MKTIEFTTTEIDKYHYLEESELNGHCFIPKRVDVHLDVNAAEPIATVQGFYGRRRGAVIERLDNNIPNNML